MKPVLFENEENLFLSYIQDLTPPLHVNFLDYDCFVQAASETTTVPASAPSQSLPRGKVSDYSGKELLDRSGFEASLRAHLRRFMQVNLENISFAIIKRAPAILLFFCLKPGS